MSLLVGGGSVRLRTEVFENQEPTNLRFSEKTSLIVLDPIPPTPFTNNNVQSINFFNTPASGFSLSNNLPIVVNNITLVDGALVSKIENAGLRIRLDNNWITLKPKVWDGTTWNILSIKIWNGNDWI
jgi:hypothetical protein